MRVKSIDFTIRGSVKVPWPFGLEKIYIERVYVGRGVGKLVLALKLSTHLYAPPGLTLG